MTVRGAGTGSHLLARGLIALGLTVAAGVACWWLLGRGVSTDDFPPFLDGQTATPITRYSGPWLTAAAGAALLAGLSLLLAVFDLLRWSRARVGSAALADQQRESGAIAAQPNPAL
ncbi:MAG: hypothetical protein ABWZ98_08610 [Nakamurella sp.]